MSAGNIKRRKGAVWVAAGVVLALLAVPEVVSAQCAMCRTALLNSREGQQLARGFNRGILFLLGAPFVVFGTVAFLILKTRRTRALLASRRARCPKAALTLPFLTPKISLKASPQILVLEKIPPLQRRPPTRPP